MDGIVEIITAYAWDCRKVGLDIFIIFVIIK